MALSLPHAQRDPPPIGELVRVAQQVQQALLYLHLIGTDRTDIVRADNFQGIEFLVDQRPKRRGDIADQLFNRKLFQAQFHFLGLDLGQVEDVIDQAEQVAGRVVDPRQVFGLLAPPFRPGFVQEHFAETDDGRERRAQFVAHARQKLALGLRGDFRGIPCVLSLVQRVREFGGALFNLLFQGPAVTRQFCIALLNFCQHIIKGINEDADLITSRLYCPNRIVLILGNASSRGGQLQDRPRNQTLEFRGKIECQEGDNHHHADRNSRILAKPRVHPFQV